MAHSHHGNGIVVKNGGDIFRRELVRCVADQQAGLADGTVTDDDASVRLRVSTWAGAGRRAGAGSASGSTYLMVATTMLLMIYADYEGGKVADVGGRRSEACGAGVR